jgi:uncharacterized protein
MNALLTSELRFVGRYTLVVPAVLVGGLFAYKWRSSLAAIQQAWLSGSLATRSDIITFDQAPAAVALERTLNYLLVIWPALAFGILIAAAVRAFVPANRIARLFNSGLRGKFAAGAAGAPLMLCSCCVAPIFSTVYERSSRLGPSVALMLASPSLNPAALILTFVLFNSWIATGRLLMAMISVILGAIVVERITAVSRCAVTVAESKNETGFFKSLLEVVIRSVPALVFGILASMLFVQFVPKQWLASSNFQFLAILVTASIAVPVALPTFFEIPLALGLIAAGAPTGAAVALLFAGPAINLPSLVAVAKSTNWKVAATLAVFIWCVAVVGGLLLN